MRKKSNPLVVMGIVISVIFGFIIATAVKGHMPADVQRCSNVVFWLVFTAVTGLGTFMSGWFLNKRK